MIDLTDPSATDVREALRAHAHDVGDPSIDLPSRVERRARSLRRQRAAALSGGVAVVVAAALAIPLSLSGSSGAGSRIREVPPASTAVTSTAVPVVDNDPTTWPFRGNERISQALLGNATTAMGLIDRTTEYTVQALYADQAPYGDRILAFLAIPADSTKSVAFGVYQQPTSGTGFLIQPYDIGQAGELDVKLLNAALRTGSIPQVVIIASPYAPRFRIESKNGSHVSDTLCNNEAGTSICYGADAKTDVVQLVSTPGQVIASDKVHYDSQD